MQREYAVRESIIAQIYNTLTRAAPPAGERALKILSLPEVELVKEWRAEDRHLLEKPLDSVESPTVFTIYLPWLLGVIRLLVVNGPIEFAHLVKERAATWVTDVPDGQSAFEMTGPFSIIHLGGTDAGDVVSEVGRTLFHVWRRLKDDAYDDWLAWTRAALLLSDAKSLEVVVWSGVIISSNSFPSRVEEVLSFSANAMLRLWAIASNNRNAAKDPAFAVDELARFFAADSPECPDWGTDSSRWWLNTTISSFERVLVQIANSTQSVLRSAVAGLLSKINRREPLPPSLMTVLAKLVKDNRARVRICVDKQ